MLGLGRAKVLCLRPSCGAEEKVSIWNFQLDGEGELWLKRHRVCQMVKGDFEMKEPRMVKNPY